MKKTLLFLTTLCCVAYLYAQTNEKRPLTILNEEFFIQSDLVFEGHFVRPVYTYNTVGTTKNDDNYLISTYKVQRVYKGDPSLTGGEVYIVSQGTSLGIENDDFTNITKSYWDSPVLDKYGITEGLNNYSPYIFFCTFSDYPDNNNSTFSSIKKYRELGDDTKRPKDWGRMYAFDNKIVCEDDYLAFLKREDFYNYMMQFKGVTIPKSTPQIEIQPATQPEIEQENYDYKGTIIDSTHYEMIRDRWLEPKKKTLNENT
jgi:hypothetical protein